MVPLNLAFSSDYDDIYDQVDLFIDLLFFVDIILNFFTAYIDKSRELVTNRKVI